MFASADKALSKLGIYNDGVGTTELSTLNPTRALNPDLAEIIQIGIEHGYQQFLQVVGEGRNMSVQEVDKIAQGRVWTGVDANELGLVDQLGSLQDAIAKAAQLAKLTTYDIQEIHSQLSAQQQFLNELFNSSVKWLPQGIKISPALYQAVESLQSQTAIFANFNDPQGRYAYCPMCRVE